jgi:hypothetical protein
MLPPKITEDVKRAMFLGPLYRRISSAFPRSLFALAWIFVSVGGAYSDRTAGGNEGCFEIAVGAVFCVVLGFDTKDETGGGRLMGLAARKGVVCVKDLTCIALLRSSLRSGCEDIVLFLKIQDRDGCLLAWSRPGDIRVEILWMEMEMTCGHNVIVSFETSAPI